MKKVDLEDFEVTMVCDGLRLLIKSHKRQEAQAAASVKEVWSRSVKNAEATLAKVMK